MTTTTEKWPGRIALMVAHCAGLVDLVALPVWISALISSYRFDPQQAGGLVTLFLAGAVIASLFFAPRFNRTNRRVAATIGFALAALAFAFASTQSAFGPLALAHGVAGLSAGTALSFTHGTIGRSANPHRLFAIVGASLGVFAIIFLGVTPGIVASFGGSALFVAFAGVMAVAAIVVAALFPAPESEAGPDASIPAQKIGRAVWAGILGVSCMGVVQAMVFSFVQEIGRANGFGVAAITGIFIALGFVNLFPAPLAGILEKKISAERVVVIGPVFQALFALLITLGLGFIPYTVGALLFTFVMIFTHTFAFGLLGRLEGTGRALAATPAMLMTGAAIGPILGGTLVKAMGYPAIGVAACILAVVAIALFSQARENVSAPSARTA